MILITLMEPRHNSLDTATNTAPSVSLTLIREWKCCYT